MFHQILNSVQHLGLTPLLLFPVSRWAGPPLPVTGPLVSFMRLLLLMKVWLPRWKLGFGGLNWDAVAASP
ncbi:hypothetical protein [Sulfobacillus thermosulfidooxidans]|uniref:hypothetical protein n=1 Tax=Sulfobacillus thermosulfidooxidans TaxID=28034 RepID=UPI0006B5FA34|nr:hypothetical protein [Sulfobacillus thermosulfidooxidans]